MCVLAGIIFVSLPIMGQEMILEKRIIKEQVFSKKNTNLRAANDTQYWWPDSVIGYFSDGGPLSKSYYNVEKRTQTSSAIFFYWEFSTISTNGISYIAEPRVSYFKQPDGRMSFQYLSIDWNAYFSGYLQLYDEDNYDLKYDLKGNLILVDIGDKYNGYYFMEYRISYNDKNVPIYIERYNYGNKNTIFQYVYNEKGNLTLFQMNRIDNFGVPIIIDNSQKITIKYDTDGKPLGIYQFAGSTSLNKWLLDEYELFYYSGATNTPSAKVENKTTVNSNNQGSLDLNMNIPSDSIATGSFVVTLPDEFTLDKNNTQLTADFSNFDLVVTVQDNNSWLFEIKPKTTRSMTLATDETSNSMVHIAYTVNKNISDGSYNFTVNNIQFGTPGDDIIPLPAITVPVKVSRSGTGIKLLERNNIWVSGKNLIIRSDNACLITVYTVSGQLFKQQNVNAGETIIQLPTGTYLVKTKETVNKIVVW